MKLQDLATPKKTRLITKTFESYFGSNIAVDQLNAKQTSQMLRKVRAVIGEHNQTIARHRSERNPAYLKLMMMEQALTTRLREMQPPATGAVPAPANGSSTQVNPKLKAAQDKLKKGQSLSPEEQQLVNAQAAAVAESRLRRAYRMLKESEVQQAQVVLAAQDMVDKMQGMLEDVSELQFKELPALVDSIKNQVGVDQAAQFNTDATAALTGLLQNIQGAKQQLDQALGVVTGQAAPSTAGADLGADIGAEVGADMGAEAGADMAADAGDELDAAAADAMGGEEPAGSDNALGRSRR
jgi:hypothetical protein